MSIEELIEIEQNYIKAHADSPIIHRLNDCDIDDDLDFLRRGDIKDTLMESDKKQWQN